MALKLKIGSPVAGEDFFGRNAELRLLLEELERPLLPKG